MADDGKLDRLWDHLDERLTKLEELLKKDRLKEVIKEALAESKAMSELKQQISEIKKP